MKESKTDWWFISMLILLALIVLLDVILTLGGMNLGFKEGNTIILFLFKYIGLRFTFFLVSIMTLTVIYLFWLIRKKAKKEWEIRICYLMVALALTWRAFAIGAWVGMINARLS